MAMFVVKLRWAKDKKAVIGIGTLIVFIALVLVAAIASAVILKTAYGLKDSAEKTGKAAQKEINGGLKILDIVGDRGAAPMSANIIRVRFTVTVWDGSDGVNIEWLRIHWIGPTQSVYLTLNRNTPNTASATDFGADEIPNDNDPNDGWDEPSFLFFLINENVLWIEIDLTLATGINDPLPPGSTATVYFEPASGLVVEESFTTPTSYGTNRYIDLTNA